MSETISIKNGNLYVGRDLYKKFFAGIETIALLKRDTGFLVMPVFSQASGGRLLKMRNPAGDRVVTATDFLQDFNLAEQDERVYTAIWDSSVAALFIDLDQPIEQAN